LAKVLGLDPHCPNRPFSRAKDHQKANLQPAVTIGAKDPCRAVTTTLQPAQYGGGSDAAAFRRRPKLASPHPPSTMPDVGDNRHLSIARLSLHAGGFGLRQPASIGGAVRQFYGRRGLGVGMQGRGTQCPHSQHHGSLRDIALPAASFI
jgi:hypothetical protein